MLPSLAWAAFGAYLALPQIAVDAWPLFLFATDSRSDSIPDGQALWNSDILPAWIFRTVVPGEGRGKYGAPDVVQRTSILCGVS